MDQRRIQGGVPPDDAIESGIRRIRGIGTVDVGVESRLSQQEPPLHVIRMRHCVSAEGIDRGGLTSVEQLITGQEPPVAGRQSAGEAAGSCERCS
jgi:hypothetical protein